MEFGRKEESTEARLIAAKELTIAQYFDEYAALKKLKGYLLLEKDFENLYKGQYTEITESFPTIKPKIFELAKARKRSGKDKNLELLLTYEQGSEETSNIACLLLIPSLLAVTSVRLKNAGMRTLSFVSWYYVLFLRVVVFRSSMLHDMIVSCTE